MARKRLEYNLNYPLGITSFKGMNMPWLSYERGANPTDFTDGYGDGWRDANFNATNAHDSMEAQLDMIAANGVKYIRVWLNMRNYFNADQDDVGYTAFQNGILTNVATYADWCAARNIKMLINFEDSWITFRWDWLSDEEKKTATLKHLVMW